MSNVPPHLGERKRRAGAGGLGAATLASEAEVTLLCREWLVELDTAKAVVASAAGQFGPGGAAPPPDQYDFRRLMGLMVELSRRQATASAGPPLPMSAFVFSDPSGLDAQKGYGFAWPHLLVATSRLEPALGPMQIEHVRAARPRAARRARSRRGSSQGSRSGRDSVL